MSPPAVAMNSFTTGTESCTQTERQCSRPACRHQSRVSLTAWYSTVCCGMTAGRSSRWTKAQADTCSSMVQEVGLCTTVPPLRHSAYRPMCTNKGWKKENF